MRKPIEYAVITLDGNNESALAVDFAQAIGELIADGWTPQGGMCVTQIEGSYGSITYRLWQAMVLCGERSRE